MNKVYKRSLLGVGMASLVLAGSFVGYALGTNSQESSNFKDEVNSNSSYVDEVPSTYYVYSYQLTEVCKEDENFGDIISKVKVPEGYRITRNVSFVSLEKTNDYEYVLLGEYEPRESDLSVIIKSIDGKDVRLVTKDWIDLGEADPSKYEVFSSLDSYDTYLLVMGDKDINNNSKEAFREDVYNNSFKHSASLVRTLM